MQNGIIIYEDKITKTNLFKKFKSYKRKIKTSFKL